MTLWLVNKCIQTARSSILLKAIAKTKTIGERYVQKNKIKGETYSSIKKILEFELLFFVLRNILLIK